MKSIIMAAVLSTSMFTLNLFAAELLKQGDALPSISLNDQHDKPAKIASSTTRIIFAADNTGASMVTALLDSKAPSWLVDTNSAYLADIHKMPGFVTRMFALPQLREKPYTIILGREEADLAMFPRQKGCVTLLPISQEKLGEAQFACSEDELKSQLY